MIPSNNSGDIYANLKALHQFDSDQMLNLIDIISNNLPVKKNNWLILGTSNGCIAAFRFAYISPELFDGIIVIPGALSFEDIHDKWSDYKIMLCCGENDEISWHNAMNRDLELLSTKVEKVFTYIIEDEGHILSPSYNQDLIYDLYFQEVKR
jgi:predicted esterase